MINGEVRPQPAGQDADASFLEAPLKPSLAFDRQKNDGARQVYTNLNHDESWSSSFLAFIEDEEGFRLFRQYLESEQNSILLELWLACQKFKANLPNKAAAKSIQQRFVRVKDVRVPLSDQARNNLASRIRANDIREDLLDEIESEIYQSLRDVWYTRFLKSDFLKGCRYQFTSNSSTIAVGFSEGKPPRSPLLRSQRADDIEFRMHSKMVLPFVGEDASSDVLSGSDGISLGSIGVANLKSGCHYDDLPNPPSFKPRTQRMNREKPLPPNEFARILCEKLMKVVEERSSQETRSLCKEGAVDELDSASVCLPALPPGHGTHLSTSSDYTAYPLPGDRPSVAGQSSHSGSGAPSQLESHVYKESAKELIVIIKKQLKGTMKDCPSQAGADNSRSISHSAYSGAFPTNRDYGCSDEGSQASGQRGGVCEPRNRTQINYSQENLLSHRFPVDSPRVVGHSLTSQQGMDPEVRNVDSKKILEWMEKNALYSENKFMDTSPSYSVRRKSSRQPPVYDSSRHTTLQTIATKSQPIATDPGMPPLPPPNTSTVLEEVNRRLQPGSGPISQQGTFRRQEKPAAGFASGVLMQHSHVYPAGQDCSLPPCQYPYTGSSQHLYAEYDGRSNTGDSLWSDSRSSVSFNPAQSEISSVPSSASQMWQMDARSEVRSDGWLDDTRSMPLSDNRFSARVASDAQSGHHSEPLSSYPRDPRNLHHDPKQAPIRDSDRIQRPLLEPLQNDNRSEAFSQSSTGRSAGSGSSKSQLKNSTTVTYYFCGDPIPYRISMPSREVTLAQFKDQTRKGSFSYYFKTLSEDDGEVVFLEIKNDHDFLPRYDEKIVGKIIKNECS